MDGVRIVGTQPVAMFQSAINGLLKTEVALKSRFMRKVRPTSVGVGTEAEEGVAAAGDEGGGGLGAACSAITNCTELEGFEAPDEAGGPDFLGGERGTPDG